MTTDIKNSRNYNFVTEYGFIPLFTIANAYPTHFCCGRKIIFRPPSGEIQPAVF